MNLALPLIIVNLMSQTVGEVVASIYITSEESISYNQRLLGTKNNTRESPKIMGKNINASLQKIIFQKNFGPVKMD